MSFSKIYLSKIMENSQRCFSEINTNFFLNFLFFIFFKYAEILAQGEKNHSEWLKQTQKSKKHY